MKPLGIENCLTQRAADAGNPVWITALSDDDVKARAEAAPVGPLAGATFAIKDNIDLAGVPTTASCPDYEYTPEATAPVVQRLLDAGAVPLGKSNLDQFATGLVGVRSPYGVPVNPFGADYVPGGSSCGSAVAVSTGQVDFALGTDTAGSGRVPAAFNELIGHKPTKGLLSTRGVVPACRTLDCVSIFTRTIADAASVLAVAAGYDEEDPYSRPAKPPVDDVSKSPRIGVPKSDQLEFYGDEGAAALFARAVNKWKQLGATIIEIDYSPFSQAARLLYEGPWVAERFAAIKELITERPEKLLPVIQKIVGGAKGLEAVAAFEAQYRLAALRRRADAVWKEVDVLLTPTTPTIYKVAEVEADPVHLNSNLGHYTNHMNLLDMCAVAVPAGRLPDNNMPWGVTLSAPAFCDDRVLRLGATFVGEAPPTPALAQFVPKTRVAVCGAHLSGLPLNHQLTERGGVLVEVTTTAPNYRLYALPGTTPPKPGMVRVEEGGAPISVEVWELPTSEYGSFVAGIPSPLGIGTVTLADGTAVQGFVCESVATTTARDVSESGGWRAYLRSQESP